MWWHLLLAIVIVASAQAFSIVAPISWTGRAGTKFIMAPRTFLYNAVVPQDLAIWDGRDLTSRVVPSFTMKFDEITWDRYCIEGDTLVAVARVNHCTGKPAQKWEWVPDAQGQGMFQLKGSGKCLDVEAVNDGALDGALVGLRDCDDEGTKSWKFELNTRHRHAATNIFLKVPLIFWMATSGVFGIVAWVARYWSRTLAMDGIVASGAFCLVSCFVRSRSRPSARDVHQPWSPLRIDQGGVSLARPLPIVEENVLVIPDTIRSTRISSPRMGVGFPGTRLKRIRSPRMAGRFRGLNKRLGNIFKLDLSENEAQEEASIMGPILEAPEMGAASSVGNAAKTLNAFGVTRLDKAVSRKVAEAALAEVNQNLEMAQQKTEAGTAGMLGEVLCRQNRYDVLLNPKDEACRMAAEAVRTALAGQLGDLFLQLGIEPDAPVHEFAALVTDPGAPRQPLHPGTPYQQRMPLITVCLALQDVEAVMGPPIFLLRTQREESHKLFNAGGRDKKQLVKITPWVASTLKAGDVAIYDSRILHAGGENTSDQRRAMLYFTIADPRAELSRVAPGSISPSARGCYTFRDLKTLTQRFASGASGMPDSQDLPPSENGETSFLSVARWPRMELYTYGEPTFSETLLEEPPTLPGFRVAIKDDPIVEAGQIVGLLRTDIVPQMMLETPEVVDWSDDAHTSSRDPFEEQFLAIKSIIDEQTINFQSVLANIDWAKDDPKKDPFEAQVAAIKGVIDERTTYFQGVLADIDWAKFDPKLYTPLKNQEKLEKSTRSIETLNEYRAGLLTQLNVWLDSPQYKGSVEKLQEYRSALLTMLSSTLDASVVQKGISEAVESLAQAQASLKNSNVDKMEEYRTSTLDKLTSTLDTKEVQRGIDVVVEALLVAVAYSLAREQVPVDFPTVWRIVQSLPKFRHFTQDYVTAFKLRFKEEDGQAIWVEYMQAYRMAVLANRILYVDENVANMETALDMLNAEMHPTEERCPLYSEKFEHVLSIRFFSPVGSVSRALSPVSGPLLDTIPLEEEGIVHNMHLLKDASNNGYLTFPGSTNLATWLDVNLQFGRYDPDQCETPFAPAVDDDRWEEIAPGYLQGCHNGICIVLKEFVSSEDFPSLTREIAKMNSISLVGHSVGAAVASAFAMNALEVKEKVFGKWTAAV